MVVAAYPASNPGGIDLSKEVELTRSAVLYADTIDLVSPAGSILSTVDGLQSADAHAMSHFITNLGDEEIEEMAERNLSHQERDGFRNVLLTSLLSEGEIRRQYGTNAEEILDFLTQLRPILDEGARQMRSGMGDLISNSGLDELRYAYDAGVLTLSPLGETESSDPEQMMHAFAETLGNAVKDPHLRLLFDDATAKLVQELIATGEVEPSALMSQHAKEASVGTGLIARLPAFPGVPLNELLDLRGDLEEPLSRYRRVVRSFGSGLTLNAFDPEVSSEIDDLWRYTVVPTLNDLRGELANHSLVKEIARSATVDVRTVVTAAAGPSIYLGFQAVSNLETWALAAAATVTGGTAAHHLIKGTLERNKARRQTENHDLFYLLDLDRRL